MSTIPYVPTYLRATPPTIWPVTSPLDFGAIGNGSADDYPAITAALQALAARGGGTLVFPNDREFRIATPGVHGIHLQQQSNITIMMGERSRLVMDNMVDGLAVSHGIFVEGPCSNVSLIGVHVRYASLSVSRQTWAPIYFLGANLGTGDESAGGWYRGEPGGERPDLIAEGAIRNVTLENIRSENSPSVGVALIGVDTASVRDITVSETWADGIYLRSHRRVQLDGYYGYKVGDDGLSMGSEESNPALAEIEHDFHGEGSVFSNIVLEAQQPDPVPAGSVTLLGVKDTAIANVVVIDRFRAIRIEFGTHYTLGYPNLNINFLANRRVVIDNVSIDRCTQDISILPLECNAGTPDKWWRNDLTISNVTGQNGGAALDIYGPGIPLNHGTPLPIFAGMTFKNMKFTNYANVSQTFIGMVDCVFDGFETDTTISVQGFVPYTIDPDLLDGDGAPMFLENGNTFRNFKGSTMTFQGLKRCWFDNLQSSGALRDAIVFLNCADITVGTIYVKHPNRIDDPIANGAVTIDEFCKRCSIDQVVVEQDTKDVHSMGFRGSDRHHVGAVKVKTERNIAPPYVTLISDRRWIDSKVSQVGRSEWLHTGSSVAQWGDREFPRSPQPALHGTGDFSVWPEGDPAVHRIVGPLLDDCRVTLFEARAAIGDRIEFRREYTSSGFKSVEFLGQAPLVSPAPQSDAYTSFSVTGGPGGSLTSIVVETGAVELLAHAVNWTDTDENTTVLVAEAINAGSHGFVATATQKLIFLRAPDLSRKLYNNSKVSQATTGDMLLAYGFIPRMIGGNDATSAGEVTAYSSFLIVGDTPTYAGTIASIAIDTDDGVVELLSQPVVWGPDSNRTAFLVAEAAMENYASHGFTVASSRNCVLMKAPTGLGATPNGWTVTVTPTGDVTTYDVKPFSGGRSPDPASTEKGYLATTTTTDPEALYLGLEAAVGDPSSKTYTFSLFAKQGTGAATGWFIELRDGADHLVAGLPLPPLTSTWTRYTVTATFPGSSATDVRVYLARMISPGAIGSTVEVAHPRLTVLGDPGYTNLLTTDDWADPTYGHSEGYSLGPTDDLAPSEPYTVLKTTPGATFHAVFEYAADGWKNVSLTYDNVLYPNGRPLFDAFNRPLSSGGHPIVDEFGNLKYASGAVLGWDSGMLAMGLSAPPATSSAFGQPGMITWDAGYLYVCTAANEWKRLALSSF